MQVVTLAASAWERIALIGSKCALPLTHNHGNERRVKDVSEPMAG